ncbi:isoleucine--tRNA ligase [Chloroflexota bacterium]
MFHPVINRVNFPKMEEDILCFWKDKDVFKRSVEYRKGNPRFVLYEGPPTANGNPGIHHVLSRVFKDIITRYKVMKGFYAPRIGGWDTHGLPVELEVEKKLGFSGKAQIEEYGVDRFNALCKESVFTYLKEWEAMTERIAYWVDLDNAYITMKNEYIESVWWAIKQMWDKGLVYQGYKVTPHCPRCGTSLSSHEVALGYQEDTEDPSVYIKFRTRMVTGREDEVSQNLQKLAESRETYFLAWTTTPWTLPGNTALAVAPDDDYAVVDYDGTYLILSDALQDATGLSDYEVVERVKGSYLENAEYEPLFNPHKYGVQRLRPRSRREREAAGLANMLVEQSPDESLTYRVISADFVSMDDGTGIVHVAPAFGEVDFEVGMLKGLDFVQPVDLQGNMIGSYAFTGKFVKDADPLVLEDLTKRDLLYRSEKIKHTYPFCWRCDSPLLYYAKQTWYIGTTVVKEALIAGNEEINWYPEHIKYGRFGDWLKNNVDWAFSRERYWGTPLPVWRCEACGHTDCVGGLGELKNKEGLAGINEPLDLHRPFVDDITFTCSKCGLKMKRAPEVIDCWFDSGSMPVAQLHYPFENKKLFDDELKQADYICEAVDQTRGWFYSLHAISTLLFDRPCYKNVICLGHILDARGEKMSKTRGNVVEPQAILDKYGADALRWYFFTASPPGNVRRFTEKSVAEITRRFLLTLWNVYSFFVTYANIDKFDPALPVDISLQPELDRWIASEINQLIVDVDAAMDNYNPTDAGRKIESFVDDLSNWYVRRSRRRFWKSENDTDKLSAYTTLYQCLVTLAKLIAPFTPFLADELYRNLVGSSFPQAQDSVHLADFPVADAAKIDEELSADTHLVMKIASLGRAARSRAGIKVRQPLAHVVVSVSTGEQKILERLKPQVLEELNVKDMEFGGKPESLDKLGYVVNTEGNYAVAMPTDISEELIAEGLAREVVHRLQMLRRSAGFDIADHITTYYQGDSFIMGIMENDELSSYIKHETLTSELIEEAPSEDAFSESYKLGGHEILLGVKKLS